MRRGSLLQCAVMLKHRRQNLPLFWDLPPLASGSPTASVKNIEPMVLKCICAGGKVPFYCPAHGRVENPNWPTA